jgi:hypothetical protein
MEPSLSRRWIRAVPFAFGCIALWTHAFWAYKKIPHIHNLYQAVNHPARFHRPETTAEYIFGFVAAATVCARVAVLLITERSDNLDAKLHRRFGMAILVMLMFGLGALARLHSVRTIYGI